MSGYLYFLNNVKNIRRPYVDLHDKLENPFPINSNSFQRKPELISLIFYSSIIYAFETVFISEQIAENRFGVF